MPKAPTLEAATFDRPEPGPGIAVVASAMPTAATLIAATFEHPQPGSDIAVLEEREVENAEGREVRARLVSGIVDHGPRPYFAGASLSFGVPTVRGAPPRRFGDQPGSGLEAQPDYAAANRRWSGRPKGE